MKYETTQVTIISIHLGEADTGASYMNVNLFGELYGFLLRGNVTLVFDSKKSIEVLQNALTELKEKWLVEEQKEVTASA